jgi:hypothetical protein
MACIDNPDAGQKAIARMAEAAKAKDRPFRGFNLFLNPNYRLFLTLAAATGQSPASESPICTPPNRASPQGAPPTSWSACAPVP